MNTSNYFKQFKAGIELAAELEKDYWSAPGKLRGFLDYVDDAISPRNIDVYKKMIPIISEIARKFTERHDPITQLGRRCHTLSDNFNRGWRAHVGNMPIWLLLTVGDVKYKGESVYDVTQSKVVDCVQKGFQPTEALGVHVWLTLEDMTIFDLTIMASLLRLGWISREQYDANPIIIGKPDELKDFVFTPYLVDNDFVAKVDRPAPGKS